ncbi:MAG TPA: 50S ribosomal protein L9 [Candidatus Andersenbacteria bacterium]|nr:50S ribosomal protein L9 [Candidatus Andersenbacteria bacterium]
MTHTLQVLLLEDIDTLGNAGNIVSVPDGYARNFLFPNGKAALATKQVQEKRNAKDAAARKIAEEELKKFQATADRLENTEIFIKAKVRNGEDIYGSILAKTILERLHADFSLSVPLKNIKGQFPLKKLGTYDVTVQLGQGVEFHMHVTVTTHEE